MDQREANRPAAVPRFLDGHAVRDCPGCLSAMAYADLHPGCIGCMGLDHAVEAFVNPSSCSVCCEFTLARLRSRLDKAKRGLAAAKGMANNNYYFDPEVGVRAEGSSGHGRFGASCSGAPRGVGPSATFVPRFGLLSPDLNLYRSTLVGLGLLSPDLALFSVNSRTCTFFGPSQLDSGLYPN